MATDQYFDMRNLVSPRGPKEACPVAGCSATLEKVKYQKGTLNWCPAHMIRIHQSSPTFVYFNGDDADSKRAARVRNIRFNRDYFNTHFLGNKAKAETHRMGYETSEDALTWNVFSRLEAGGFLGSLLSSLTGMTLNGEPELYLWGLRVDLTSSSAPAAFQPLTKARAQYERGIKRFLTEPDIMLYVPGKILFLIEAKFTSGNTIAFGTQSQDGVDEKPKSREGLLRRYAETGSTEEPLAAPPALMPFYGQLFRNVVFARHMANELKVEWGLASLVSELQFRNRSDKQEFQDPTPFVRSLLPTTVDNRFRFYSWERLYANHVAGVSSLVDLDEYMSNKSAACVRALSI